MKHYPHHIADFDRATRHLNRLERSVYRDMMDLYYDTEKELPLDTERLCCLILARSNEESTAVQRVLNEFFIRTDTGWFSSRCDHEIHKFHANNSQKALAGKASAAARATRKQEKINKRSTPVEIPLNGETTPEQNHKPEPINHEPVVLASQSNLPATTETAVAKAPAKTVKGSRLQKDWVLPSPWGLWAMEKGLTREQVLHQAQKFRNYWVAKSGKDAAKVDWEATWHNWILKTVEEHGNKKTFAEKTQDFKDKQADEFYQGGISDMTDDELRRARLI